MSGLEDLVMTRITSIVAVLVLATAAQAGAQDDASTPGSDTVLRPGWVFTPSLAFIETYDDNVTLFGRGTADDQNNDYISSVAPRGSVTFLGRHTRMTAGYGGSFLNYRTLSVFNRWDQSGQFDLRRRENAHFDWFTHAAGAIVPSTDALEFNGIPFSHTGAKTLDTRTGAGYKLNARDTISSSIEYQSIAFDNQAEFGRYLRGGTASSWTSTFTHQINSRATVGADYAFVHSHVRQDVDQSAIHTVEGSVEYKLSDVWDFSGAAGFTILAANVIAPGQTAPALRASVGRSARATRFRVEYAQRILPAFGLGGSAHTQELGASYYMPLFHSRHFYMDHSAIFRNDTPVVPSSPLLNLRSIRTTSTVGWSPQPWFRIEGFYSRLSQSTLIAGGRLDRDRVGFQIVTSKPMRMQ
jgi:hypothetical protein